MADPRPPTSAPRSPGRDRAGTEERRRAIRREWAREVARVAIVVFIAAVPLGVGFFALSSSRGLDALEVAALLSTAFIVAAALAGVVSLGRWVMARDSRLVVAVLAGLLGLFAGDALRPRLVAGSTTDGRFEIARTAPDGSVTVLANGYATCIWEPADAVSAVLARRTFGVRGDLYPYRMQLELSEPDRTVGLDRLGLTDSELLEQWVGPATIVDRSEDSRTGRLSFVGLPAAVPPPVPGPAPNDLPAPEWPIWSIEIAWSCRDALRPTPGCGWVRRRRPASPATSGGSLSGPR